MGNENILSPTMEILRSFWSGLSTLLAAAVVFIIGWLIIRLLLPVLTRLFRLVRLDTLVAATGFKEMLEKGKIRKSFSEMLALAVYWILMLVVVFVALSVAGIEVPEAIIAELLAFIPRLILGLIVFILSVFLARLVQGIVQTATANAGVAGPEALGKISEVAIIAFGSVLALQVIGIAAAFLASAFNIVLAALSFGFALAFALGAKDIAREYLESLVGRKSGAGKEKKQAGS